MSEESVAADADDQNPPGCRLINELIGCGLPASRRAVKVDDGNNQSYLCSTSKCFTRHRYGHSHQVGSLQVDPTGSKGFCHFL